MNSKSDSGGMAVAVRFCRHFASLIRQQRLLIAGSFALLFVEVALRVLEPWPLKYIIDDILVPAVAGGAAEVPVTVLVLACAAVVVLAGSRAFASYGKSVGFALAGNRILVRVREHLFQHVQQLSLDFHARSRSGDMIYRVMADVGLLKDVAVTAFMPLIGACCVFAAMLAVMLWLNAVLALVALSVAPLVLLFARRRSRQIRVVAKEQRRRESTLASITSESLGAIGAVQSLSLADHLADSFAASSSQDLSSGVRGKRLAAGLERSVDVAIALATALVLGVGTLQALNGRLTPGELIVFLAYLKTAFRPMQDWAKYTGRLSRATAAADRVMALVAERPQVQDLPNARRAPPLRGSIEFRDVAFGYGTESRALEHVSLSVAAHERIALLGGSGAGKSTLLALLLRLYDVSAGRIEIDGRDIREYTLESLRRQISVLMQQPTLFAATIAENIGYGAIHQRFDQAAIEAAARRASIHDFVASLPDGYATPIGERGLTLSAGQRQRIAIARAFLRNAPILILDEPTAGLDADSEARVIEALRKLAQGRTTFIATHDLSRVSWVDRVVAIERGTVVERSHLLATQRLKPAVGAGHD